MNTFKIRVAFLSFLLISAISYAQPAATSPSLDETVMNSGKMYVVIAVLAVILIGIFIYLFSLDRKLRKLEEKAKMDK
jgi:CcmD family protein